jgi:hypothetical protein
MGFFSKRNFRLLFFAVVRFSPPSQETEAVKRKAEVKNNSPDLQEPTFNLLVAARAKPEAAPGPLCPLWLVTSLVASPDIAGELEDHDDEHDAN